jgi:hypothetical protein
MRFNFRSLMVTAAFLAAASSQASADVINTFTDGDFSPGTALSFQTYNATQTFGAWNVTSGSVDLIGTYWNPPAGTPNGFSVDLNGSEPGTISQTFQLSAGTYTVGFYLSGNPDGGQSAKTVNVLFGSAAANDPQFTYTATIDGNHALTYIQETFSQTVDGGLVILSFSGDLENGAYGPVIGDVTVTAAVPEPSTWAMMLLGFCGLGFMTYRRKNLAARTLV